MNNANFPFIFFARPKKTKQKKGRFLHMNFSALRKTDSGTSPSRQGGTSTTEASAIYSRREK